MTDYLKIARAALEGSREPAKPAELGVAGSTLEHPSKVSEMNDREPTAPIAEAVPPKPSKTAKNLADVDPEEPGVPCAEWKARELNRTFAEHGTGGPGRITAVTVQDGLEKEANREPAKPLFGRPLAKVTQRSTGQTVTFGTYEWIYNPLGITAATIRQIEELSAKGEGPIEVIQWPAGEVVFTDGKWKDADD